MNDELIQDTDELIPSPPQTGAPIDDEIDASLLADVPKMGDCMPAGTFAFRLEKFTEAWTEEDFESGRKFTDEEKQPLFNLQWRCQQEPHVGRVVFERVPWVRAETIKAANDPQNPARGSAQAIINKALPRAKQIMEAAGFAPTGKFGFRQFLGSNPEMKLQINVAEKKMKDPAGKWVGSGEMKNNIVKHLSLHRPA